MRYLRLVSHVIPAAHGALVGLLQQLEPAHLMQSVATEQLMGGIVHELEAHRADVRRHVIILLLLNNCILFWLDLLYCWDGFDQLQPLSQVSYQLFTISHVGV